MKKFYAFLAAAAVALSASAEDFYLIGGFNSWTCGDESAKFQATETEGVYVLEYKGTLTSGFKINNGGWDDAAYNFGAANDKDYLTLGEEFDLSVGLNSKNIAFDGTDAVENPTLTLNVTDLDAPVLLVEGETVEVDYDYYLVGSLNGWGDGFVADYLFTKNDGVLTLNGVELVAEDGAELAEVEFKISDPTWGSQFGASDETPEINADCMTVTLDGSENVQLALAPGAYDFVFTIETKELVVTSAAGIQGVAVDANAPAVYYNLQGVRVANPENGLFIVRQGGKASKVLVK